MKEQSAKAVFYLFLEHITNMTDNFLVKKEMLKGRKHLRNKFSSFTYIHKQIQKR